MAAIRWKLRIVAMNDLPAAEVRALREAYPYQVRLSLVARMRRRLGINDGAYYAVKIGKDIILL